LGAIVAIMAKVLEADLCAFLLHDEGAGELVTQPGAYGLSSDESVHYRMPLTNDRSSSVRVFMTGVPFLTGDAQNDPQVISDYAKKWQMHSLIVVPLSIEDRRIGVMRVGSSKRNYFTQDHVRLVELIAEEAVVLIEGAMLQKKLAEANQQLSEINRIKDDFVSMVSHEFKTPLTSIKGFLSLALEGASGPLTEDQRRFLIIALSAADRLAMLVADLLDLSRLEGGLRMEFAPVSLVEVIEACRQDHQQQAQNRSVELRAALGAKLPEIWGDPKWLRQLVDNLLSNALKFTPDGGQVGLNATRTEDGIHLEVWDTGIGIDAKDYDKLFKEFQQVDSDYARKYGGSGLGLALSKRFAEMHGGRIWCESAGKDQGTRFHVLLPFAPSVPQGAAAPSGVA